MVTVYTTELTHIRQQLCPLMAPLHLHADGNLEAEKQTGLTRLEGFKM